MLDGELDSRAEVMSMHEGNKTTKIKDVPCKSVTDFDQGVPDDMEIEGMTDILKPPSFPPYMEKNSIPLAHIHHENEDSDESSLTDSCR